MHALSRQCGQGISTSWISSFWMLKIHLVMQACLISLLKVFFSKVSREAVLPLFNEMFAAISCVVADPDQNVKNGSELLDRWEITNLNFAFFKVWLFSSLSSSLLSSPTSCWTGSWKTSSRRARPSMSNLLFLPYENACTQETGLTSWKFVPHILK